MHSIKVMFEDLSGEKCNLQNTWATSWENQHNGMCIQRRLIKIIIKINALF